MILFHLSPRRNLRSIERHGLLPGRSRGRRRVVWACTFGRLTWAMKHVARRHSVPLSSLELIEVAVPRHLESVLRRTGRPGVYTCACVMPPNWLSRFGEVLEGRREDQLETFEREED